MEKKENWFLKILKKKRTKKDIIYDVILLVAVCVFIFSAVVLVKYFYGLHENKQAYDQIKNELVVTNSEGEKVWVWDYQKMISQYPNIKGWITQGEFINYPIVQSDDNAYYLTHNAANQYNGGGAIFIDYRNDLGLEDSNSIIYGHNMRNESMFGSLKNYADYSYYEANKYFDVYIAEKHYKYEVFSAYYTSDVSEETYRYDFASDSDFIQYLNNSRSSSLYQTDCRELTADDKVITLSTCTNTDRSKRMIVQIVRSEEVYDSIN